MTDGAPRVSLRSRLARINFVVLAFASVLVTACIALTSAWLAVQRQVDEAHLRLDLLREGQPPALVIADEAAAGRHFAALRSMPYLLAVDVFSGDGRLLASAGADQRVLLRDADNGALRAPPLVGHQDTITHIAFSPDGKRLVTGESLAQVASQTVKALQCTDAAQDLPILRPLIGMDKTEIIETSRHINTFETSILPYEDCCTIFTPPHPKTKPSLAEIEAAEAGMPGLAELERIAAETVEKIPIRIGDDPEF